MKMVLKVQRGSYLVLDILEQSDSKNMVYSNM